MDRNKMYPQDLADTIMREIVVRVLHDKPPQLPFSDWVAPDKDNRKLRRAKKAFRKANKKRK